MKITQYIIIMFKLMIASVVSIIILSCFCMIYSYTGVHITNENGATDYKWLPNQYKATMTEGYAWIKFDENGFNNLSSSTNNIDILLMGSSHMEAVQISQEKNVCELLNEKLELKTYNIGMSGHQIYNIVNNFSSAIDYYKPKQYVIIETDNIDLDEKYMKDVVNHGFEKIKSYDNGFFFHVQKIPALKSIYKQLQDWIDLESINTNEYEFNNKEDDYLQVMYDFLNLISVQSIERGITPIIFYHPKEKLDINGNIIYMNNKQSLKDFRAICTNLNIVFIDMTGPFYESYKENYQLAHGFSNTHVGSGHLNSNGHRIIAETIINKINELKGEKNVVE